MPSPTGNPGRSTHRCRRSRCSPHDPALTDPASPSRVERYPTVGRVAPPPWTPGPDPVLPNGRGQRRATPFSETGRRASGSDMGLAESAARRRMKRWRSQRGAGTVPTPARRCRPAPTLKRWNTVGSEQWIGGLSARCCWPQCCSPPQCYPASPASRSREARSPSRSRARRLPDNVSLRRPPSRQAPLEEARCELRS